MNIFLIGFMGSGKTYWGKLWAAENNIPFFDLDNMIEARTGKTVAALFEQDDEHYFREQEHEVLRTFAGKDNCIVSCGGGTPCFNDNMQWMEAHGTTIYLSASPQYIYNRVIEEKDKRPLLKNINPAELLFFIEQKLKEREGFYKQAQYILPVKELTVNSLQAIIQQ